MHDLRPSLIARRGEVIRQQSEVVGEWWGLVVQVDEDETAPRVDSHLGQRELALIDMREVPLPRNPLQVSVEPIRPSVERAGDLRQVATARTQLRSPVQTRVV